MPLAEKALILEYALAYARHGLAVFPLQYAGKIPMKGTHGHKDATTDESIIKRWFDPTGEKKNIGIATGSISGFWVLDIDPRNGGEDSHQALKEEIGPLPCEWMVLTGGGGWHYYFKWNPAHPVKCGHLDGYEGIDLKGDGGYIVAPPSNHPSGGFYEWT